MTELVYNNKGELISASEAGAGFGILFKIQGVSDGIFEIGGACRKITKEGVKFSHAEIGDGEFYPRCHRHGIRCVLEGVKIHGRVVEPIIPRESSILSLRTQLSEAEEAITRLSDTVSLLCDKMGSGTTL